MTIEERLEQIRITESRRIFAELVEKSYKKPLKTDIGDMSSFYDRFLNKCNPDNHDNNRIFAFIAFFVYDPASLIHKRVTRGDVRKEVSKVLGVSVSAVTRQVADGKFLFLHHKGFKKEVERVFAAMTEES